MAEAKIKVQANPDKVKRGKDGGHPVVLWEKNDRHPDGELFIADDEEHLVVPTAAVMAKIATKELVEVSKSKASADESKSSGAPDKDKK